MDAGMLAMASAYVMKRRLGPERERKGGSRLSPRPAYRDVSEEISATPTVRALVTNLM